MPFSHLSLKMYFNVFQQIPMSIKWIYFEHSRIKPLTLAKSVSYSTLSAAQPHEVIFMHAMILSHMSYCITCWGQAGEIAIKPLESLYKQTLKTQYEKPIHHHHYCKTLKITEL